MRYTEFQAHDGCLIGHNPLEGNRVEHYLIGVIDILVQYSARKKLENFFRGTIGGAKARPAPLVRTECTFALTLPLVISLLP